MKNITKIPRRPLLLATSGGAGCLTAIEAIAAQLRAEGVILPIHQPILRKDKTVDELAYGINMASIVMNTPLFGALASSINFPVIPSMESIEKEMAAIESKQKERIYIDFLLDVVESGYVLAAIADLNSKKTNVTQSRKLVDRQRDFERLQFKRVKSFFLDKLQEAKKNGTPYTEIITTQMISMDAICAAVLEYNALMSEDEPIHIHQYLSDVFTPDAQHYVNSLKELDHQARSVLHLHGMNIAKTADTLLQTDSKGQFASIEEVDYLDNPMVRQGFKRKDLAQYRIGSLGTQNIPIQNENGKDTTNISVGHDEKVAAIMLSSVAGESTVNYASLLGQLNTDDKADYDKIFVFCGRNQALKEQLELEKRRLKGRERFLDIKKPCEIILLGSQDADHVANIFTRSDLTAIRGGVVVMEQMALGKNHHPNQRYFFPHLRNDKNNLTTGLPWEDASISHLIDHFKEVHGISDAKKGEIDDLRFMLKPKWRILDELNRYKSQLNSNQLQVSQELNAAILSLLEELSQDLEKQYSSNTSEKAISQSVAYKLAMGTMKYIDQFTYLLHVDQSVGEEKKQKLIKLVTEYDIYCHPIASNSKFSAGVIGVITLSAVVVGALIVGAFIVGACMGLWTGPGAIAAGLFAAGVVAAGAGAGALLLSNSFFKPKPIEQKIQTLVDCMQQDYNSCIL